MGQITVEKNVGGIEGLCVITPAVHGDARGYFMETYSQRDMEEAGIKKDLKQLGWMPKKGESHDAKVQTGGYSPSA